MASGTAAPAQQEEITDLLAATATRSLTIQYYFAVSLNEAQILTEVPDSPTLAHCQTEARSENSVTQTIWHCNLADSFVHEGFVSSDRKSKATGWARAAAQNLSDD